MIEAYSSPRLMGDVEAEVNTVKFAIEGVSEREDRGG